MMRIRSLQAKSTTHQLFMLTLRDRLNVSMVDASQQSRKSFNNIDTKSIALCGSAESNRHMHLKRIEYAQRRPSPDFKILNTHLKVILMNLIPFHAWTVKHHPNSCVESVYILGTTPTR